MVIISLFSILGLFNSVYAQEECSRENTYQYEEKDKQIEDDLKNTKIVMEDALALIKARRIAKAEPYVLDSIRMLKKVISDSNNLKVKLVHRAAECPRYAGFLFMIRNRVDKRIKNNEVEDILSDWEEFKRKNY